MFVDKLIFTKSNMLHLPQLLVHPIRSKKLEEEAAGNCNNLFFKLGKGKSDIQYAFCKISLKISR